MLSIKPPYVSSSVSSARSMQWATEKHMTSGREAMSCTACASCWPTLCLYRWRVTGLDMESSSSSFSGSSTTSHFGLTLCCSIQMWFTSSSQHSCGTELPGLVMSQSSCSSWWSTHSWLESPMHWRASTVSLTSRIVDLMKWVDSGCSTKTSMLRPTTRIRPMLNRHRKIWSLEPLLPSRTRWTWWRESRRKEKTFLITKNQTRCSSNSSET